MQLLFYQTQSETKKWLGRIIMINVFFVTISPINSLNSENLFYR